MNSGQSERGLVENKSHSNSFGEKPSLKKMTFVCACVLNVNVLLYLVCEDFEMNTLMVEKLTWLHTPTNTSVHPFWCSCLGVTLFLFSLSFGQSLGTECEFTEMSPQCFEFPLY